VIIVSDKKIFIAYNFQNNRIKGVGAPVDNTDVATKGSAQSQADAAQAAAIAAAATDATTKANTAVTTANAYTDTAVAAAGSTNLAAANAYTDTKVSALVNGAGTALDTLNELAAALGNDANFATTIAGQISTLSTAISNEVTARESADTALDGRLDIVESTLTSLGGAATTKFVGTVTGPGTVTADGVEYSLSHGLNKASILVQAYEGNDVVDVFIRKVDNTSLKVITGAALGSTTLSIVVIG
jgi:hypothetical protein